jgi:DNA-nicking Smr family endonuclease
VGKKNISAEDADLFRQSIGTVERITSDTVQHDPKHRVKKPRRSLPTEDGGGLEAKLGEWDPVGHEESIHFTATGIQKNVLEKLRKGFFGIQAELDLHGYTSAVARQRCLQFLDASVRAGHRCVHIIHGKGYRSSEEMPVLKNQLNQWLRMHGSVQAFCSAPQRHGGTGAVWVLLKIARDWDEGQ